MNRAMARQRIEDRRRDADAAGDQLVVVTPEESRRRLAASFQMNLADALDVVCPHCGNAEDRVGLALSFSFGPLETGGMVVFVRPGVAYEAIIDEVKKTLIVNALRRAHGNQARAARLLRMKYTTFHSLAKRLELS